MATTNITYAQNRYQYSGGEHDAMIGKMETPLKMIIEHESDACAKKKNVQSTLFNIERSNKFGETIIGNSDFDVFKSVEEGTGDDVGESIYEVNRRFVEHIEFMKEFVITRKMMEDSNYGVGADAKRRAENFVRAYYQSMNKICSTALINATSKTYDSAMFGTTLDLSVFDYKAGTNADTRKVALFGKHSSRIYDEDQYNLFHWGGTAAIDSTDAMGEYIDVIANRLRNFKDEHGNSLEYVADTIILPGNNAKLERMVKKVCGSEREAGTANNDINVQYGNWTIVVLPDWNVSKDAPEFMLMSSAANKNLMGNAFFNRSPLHINPWIDNHTGNYIWTGRCRFGVGFGNWKHIARASLTTTAVSENSLAITGDD